MIQEYLGRLLEVRIVLASQSPRREEILSLLGVPHERVPSRFDESTLNWVEFRDASAYVTHSAREKALEVHRRLWGEKADGTKAGLVIGADTVVILDGEILEKPKSEAHAIGMLRALSGRTHDVATGVAMIAQNGVVTEFCETTTVEFDDIPFEEMLAYVKSNEAMDKAGAYGIQGRAGSFVKGVHGCYFNVMGLPMHRLAKEIRRLIEDGKL